MEISNFKDMYLAELQELVSVEDQLAEALLRMAAAASHPALKDALVDHHAETMRQKERLVGILRQHGADPTAHVDQAMQALIRETRKMLGIVEGLLEEKEADALLTDIAKGEVNPDALAA